MAFDLSKSGWIEKQLTEQGYIAFQPEYIVDASSHGIKFGTAEFMVYQYMRWCEDHGKPIKGYRLMIAGYDHIRDWIGFEKTEDVRGAFNELRKKGAVAHIWTDQKWYRGKTQIWVSAEWLAKHPKLSVGQPTLTVGQPTLASPVPPLSEYTDNKQYSNIIKNNLRSANALTSEDATQPTTPPTAEGVKLPFSSGGSSQSGEVGGVVKNTTVKADPFEHDVDLKKEVKSKNALNAKAAVLGNRLLELAGHKNKKAGGKLITAIQRAWGLGYTDRELIMAVKRGAEVDYYKTSGIFNMLSERGLSNLTNDKWYKAEKDKQTYDSIRSHMM